MKICIPYVGQWSHWYKYIKNTIKTTKNLINSSVVTIYNKSIHILHVKSTTDLSHPRKCWLFRAAMALSASKVVVNFTNQLPVRENCIHFISKVTVCNINTKGSYKAYPRLIKFSMWWKIKTIETRKIIAHSSNNHLIYFILKKWWNWMVLSKVSLKIRK